MYRKVFKLTTTTNKYEKQKSIEVYGKRCYKFYKKAGGNNSWRTFFSIQNKQKAG